jgi:hypothetical protein
VAHCKGNTEAKIEQYIQTYQSLPNTEIKYTCTSVLKKNKKEGVFLWEYLSDPGVTEF